MAEEARVYVQLAGVWTDPAGVAHRAGEIVDIDAITLAELEEQGVVEDNMSSQVRIGPGPGEPTDVVERLIGPGPGVPDPGPEPSDPDTDTSGTEH